MTASCATRSTTTTTSSTAATTTTTTATTTTAATEVQLHPHFAVVSCYDELHTLLRNLQRGTLALAPARATAATATREPVAVTNNNDNNDNNSDDHDDTAAKPTMSVAHARSGVAETAGVYPDAAEQGSCMWLSDAVAAPSMQSNNNTAPDASTAPPHAPPRAPPASATPRTLRLLCVWDVDDTLLASGVSGVRQHNVFARNELLRLFALLDSSRYCSTRHLLLSQGSIDDVFEPDATAPLSYLRHYFARSASSSSSSLTTDAMSGQHDSKRHGDDADAAATAAAGTHARKHRGGGGLASLFGCRTTHVKTSSRARQHSSSNNTSNPCVLPRDTVVVLLDTIREAQCNSNDKRRELYTHLVNNNNNNDSSYGNASAAAPSPSPQQHQHDDANAAMTGERVHARWLLLRPDVWGVSLVPLHMAIEPSPHTAFVDAMVYRKMDVVWSLAMCGHYDTVFFIDNNLTELGVVRGGAQLLAMAHARHARPTLKQLLHTEYMQLAAAARLQQHARRWRCRRDVIANATTTTTTPITVAAPLQEDSDNNTLPSSPPSVAVRQHTDPSCNGVHTAATTTTTATCHADATTTNGSHRSNNNSNSNGDDDDGGVASVTRPVHLVVTHFHMASASYRAIVRRSRTAAAAASDGDSDNSSATARLLLRNGDAGGGSSSATAASLRALPRAPTPPPPPSRVDGQPLLNGGVSCSDVEYVCVMQTFARQLTALFQLLDEKVHASGGVDALWSSSYCGSNNNNNNNNNNSSRARWRPEAHLVRGCVWPTPPRLPHLCLFYRDVCDEVERDLVVPLLTRNNSNSNSNSSMAVVGSATASSSAAAAADDKAAAASEHALRTRAFVLHSRLLYSTLVIDPALTSALADALHIVHATEARLSAATAMQLQARVRALRAACT